MKKIDTSSAKSTFLNHSKICFLDYTKCNGFSDPFQPFKVEFKLAISKLFDPCFESLDLQMCNFLFNDIQIQKDINLIQSFLFFLDPFIPSLFCDAIKDESTVNSTKLNRILNECLSYSESKNKLNSEKFGVNIINSKQKFKFDNLIFTYNVSWPINQILTMDIQRRYSRIFCFLAKIYTAKQNIHSFRFEKSKCTTRLHLYEFLHSLGNYCMNSILIPLKTKYVWTRANNLELLYQMVTNHLEEIEQKLFLNVMLY
jgi:hypothetical protein